MVYTALVLSILSLLISVGTLIVHVSLRRRLERRRGETAFADVLARFSEEPSRERSPEENAQGRERDVSDRTEAAQWRPVPPEVGAAATDETESPTVSSADGSAPTRLEQDEVRRAVRRLADEGVDVTTIARRLRLGRGEVELFLDLSRRDASGK